MQLRHSQPALAAKRNKLEHLPAELRAAADELIAARFPVQITATYTDASPANIAGWILNDFKDFNFIGVDYGLEDSSWIRRTYESRYSAENFFKSEYLADWKYIVNTTAV